MRDLTKGSIYKSFLLFAIPLVLSGLLSQAYNVIDTVIAGKFLGEDGLAAIGATSQAIMLASSLFWGFAAGLGVYTAKLFGARDYSRLKADVYNVLLIMTVAEAALSLLLIISSGALLDVLKVEQGIRKQAQIYFVIYMIGFAAIISNNTFTHIMNALGSSDFPFYMSLLAAMLNITGNIFSVTVLRMGVEGIALSSVLAAVVVDIGFIIKLKGCFKQCGVDREKFRFSLSALRHVTRYGAPCALQQAAMYISAMAMSPIVNGISAAATAGYTVVMRIYDINAGIYQNSSKALSNYAAQCVGAGSYEKIGKGLRVGLLQSIVFVLPAVLVCSIFAVPVNRVFFPDSYSGEALGYAVMFSKIYLPFIFFNLVNNLFHSFFRGIAAMKLLIAATAIGSAVRIAAGVLFAGYFGMQGVYIGWIISWIAEALFLLAVYLLRFRNTAMIQRFVRQNIE